MGRDVLGPHIGERCRAVPDDAARPSMRSQSLFPRAQRVSLGDSAVGVKSEAIQALRQADAAACRVELHLDAAGQALLGGAGLYVGTTVVGFDR